MYAEKTYLQFKTNGFFQRGSRKDDVLSLIPRAGISREGSLRDSKGRLTKQKLVSGSGLFFFLLRLDQLRYRIS